MCTLFLKASLAILLVSLYACGGGGGGSSSHSGQPTAGDPIQDQPGDYPVQDPSTDYVTPGGMVVVPPEEAFAPFCVDGLPPLDDPVSFPGDGAPGGSHTGYLIDTAASGLAYVTGSYRGVTGPGGSFQYESGETVRFMLGDTLLGEVTGAAEVTTFDLAGTTVPTGMQAINGALDDRNHPFHRVINTAVLLQSLDRDASLENGIEITPEIAGLFKGISLNLGRPWHEFNDHHWLNYAIAQANAHGYFSEAHGTVRPARAIQHIYGVLDIDARLYGVSLEEWETRWEETSGQTTRWRYDAGGNLTWREWSDSGGRLRGFEQWTYDGSGNLTRHEREELGDETTERWRYDTAGNLIRYESVDESNQTEFADWRYQHAPDGRLLRAEFEYVAPGEEEGISSSATLVYQYRADGRLASVEFSGDGIDRAAEQQGFATVDFLGFAQNYLITYEYDAGGNLVGDRLYATHPEAGRNTVTRSYDVHGNPTRLVGHLEPNPPYDSYPGEQLRIEEYAYEYSANGDVISAVVDIDDGADGSVDRIIRYEYDSHGSLVYEAEDHDADGVWDMHQRWPYQYEYDVQGRVVHRILDWNGDGRLDGEVSYAYHPDGTLARKDQRAVAASHKNVSGWTYNHAGKLIESREDGNADGVYERVASYTYDACGNLVTRTVGRNDGNFGSTESWLYDTVGNRRRYEWKGRDALGFDGDGFPELVVIGSDEGVEVREYDGNGRLIRRRVESNGIFGDTLDFIANYDYDAFGNITRELVDRVEYDGKPDHVAVYEYDSASRIVRVLWDQNGDAIADRVEHNQYDTYGNIALQTHDSDGDGRVDSATRYQNDYDAHGNLIRTARDRDGDGLTDVVFSYNYDIEGNLVRAIEEYDDNGDGMPEESKVTHYIATGWGHVMDASSETPFPVQAFPWWFPAPF